MNTRTLSTILGLLVLFLSIFLFLFYLIAQFVYPAEGQAFSFLIAALICLVTGFTARAWAEK